MNRRSDDNKGLNRTGRGLARCESHGRTTTNAIPQTAPGNIAERKQVSRCGRLYSAASVARVEGVDPQEMSFLMRKVFKKARKMLGRDLTPQKIAARVPRVFVVAEAYPQLRAVESVQLLQERLTSTENRIAFARQCYDDEVMQFNTVQATFPRNLFSGLLGFSPTALFSAQEAERANVNVSI